MAVNSLFFSVDGTVRVERVNPFKSVLETLDGYHPMGNQGFFRDFNRRYPSVLVVWQGLDLPEGVPNESSAVSATIAEMDYTKLHKQRVRVDKRWFRSLIRFLRVMIAMLLVGFAASFLGLVIYFLVVVI